MIDDRLAVIVLAAGKGTRMRSEMAKVLHAVLARPMILHVVDAARALAGENVVVVVGHQAERVREVVSAAARVRYAHQAEQLGTGHAVLCALPVLPPACEEVVILCGDVPAIRAETIAALVADHRAAGREATVLAVEVPNPTGYGRILLDAGGRFCGIVEEADADGHQRRIRLINSGIYCVAKSYLADTLPRLRADNAQGEMYLTDIVQMGYAADRRIGVMIAPDHREIMGVNTLVELGAVEAFMRRPE